MTQAVASARKMSKVAPENIVNGKLCNLLVKNMLVTRNFGKECKSILF